MAFANDIPKLELELRKYVAEDIRENSGINPDDIKVTLKEDFLLIIVRGFLLPNEVRLAETERGPHDVKLNRFKWVCHNKDSITSRISKFLGVEIKGMFYDINQRHNIGMAVYTFE